MMLIFNKISHFVRHDNINILILSFYDTMIIGSKLTKIVKQNKLFIIKLLMQEGIMTDAVWSRKSKFFSIILIGAAMVLLVNLARTLFGDLPNFTISQEGLNISIMLFSLGAAVVGSIFSNKDRSVFSQFIIYMGIICAIMVFFAYENNPIVLAGFIIMTVIDSLLVKKVRVPYP